MILENDLRPEQYNPNSIRMMERLSIRWFVEMHANLLTGRVLDFGAGKQPYRDLVKGEYFSYELGDKWPEGKFDAILCTQVIEYVDHSALFVMNFHELLLNPSGHLILTYPTCWDEVEGDLPDYWRFTKMGIDKLLTTNGFEIVAHERRAEVNLNGFRFPLGGGVVAKNK